MKITSCASSRNMGASVEDQEAPHLLIFIERAPSKNDKLLKSDLLFAFQKHGGECTGLHLIFMLLKYVLSKQISCCVRSYMHMHDEMMKQGERRTIERETSRHTIEGEALIER